jgi:hypothetical protein
MWPFSKSTRKLETEVRKVFSEHLSEEGVEGLIRNIRNPNVEFPQSEHANVKFVLFQVRDDVLDDIPIHLEQNVQLAIDAGALVDTILSSLVFVWFFERDEAAKCREAVRAG